MKKIILSITILAVLGGFTSYGYASDWDKAGKALAVIAGARILTGGKVDIIGNVTGINHGGGSSWGRKKHKNEWNAYTKNYSCASEPVWVPRYVWRKKYIPEHREHDAECGPIIVEGHFIKYKVADGGNWK
ncbi:MAG: hypothetical protein ABH843_04005 [Candidatus Omnitrophota bacterium]